MPKNKNRVSEKVNFCNRLEQLIEKINDNLVKFVKEEEGNSEKNVIECKRKLFESLRKISELSREEKASENLAASYLFPGTKEKIKNLAFRIKHSRHLDVKKFYPAFDNLGFGVDNSSCVNLTSDDILGLSPKSKQEVSERNFKKIKQEANEGRPEKMIGVFQGEVGEDDIEEPLLSGSSFQNLNKENFQVLSFVEVFCSDNEVKKVVNDFFSETNKATLELKNLELKKFSAEQIKSVLFIHVALLSQFKVWGKEYDKVEDINYQLESSKKISLQLDDFRKQTLKKKGLATFFEELKGISIFFELMSTFFGCSQEDLHWRLFVKDTMCDSLFKEGFDEEYNNFSSDFEKEGFLNSVSTLEYGDWQSFYRFCDRLRVILIQARIVEIIKKGDLVKKWEGSNYYEVLGLNKCVSLEEVEHSFLEKKKEFLLLLMKENSFLEESRQFQWWSCLMRCFYFLEEVYCVLSHSKLKETYDNFLRTDEGKEEIFRRYIGVQFKSFAVEWMEVVKRKNLSDFCRALKDSFKLDEIFVPGRRELLQDKVFKTVDLLVSDKEKMKESFFFSAFERECEELICEFGADLREFLDKDSNEKKYSIFSKAEFEIAILTNLKMVSSFFIYDWRKNEKNTSGNECLAKLRYFSVTKGTDVITNEFYNQVLKEQKRQRWENTEVFSSLSTYKLGEFLEEKENIFEIPIISFDFFSEEEIKNLCYDDWENIFFFCNRLLEDLKSQDVQCLINKKQQNNKLITSLSGNSKNSSSKNSSDDSKWGKGLIVGLIGVVAICVLVGGLGILFWKKWMKQKTN